MWNRDEIFHHAYNDINQSGWCKVRIKKTWNTHKQTRMESVFTSREHHSHWFRGFTQARNRNTDSVINSTWGCLKKIYPHVASLRWGNNKICMKNQVFLFFVEWIKSIEFINYVLCVIISDSAFLSSKGGALKQRVKSYSERTERIRHEKEKVRAWKKSLKEIHGG